MYICKKTKIMNLIDIIIIGILLYAVYAGIKEGVVVQACSIAAIFLGLYLGSQYSESVASLFGISGAYKVTWGYLIVLIATIFAVGAIAVLTRKVVRSTGFGFLDTLLGVALSLAKYLLIMSFIFSTFNKLNDSYKFFPNDELKKSMLYGHIIELTKWSEPAWDWTKDQLDI